MLLDDQGRLELSSNQADGSLYGERIQLPGIAKALRPGGSANHSYSQPSQAEIVDVLFPIRDPDRRLVGFVRLTYHLSGVYERTLNVRYIILAVLTIGLALGVIAG
jgi:sensor histidine kinase regulating citrate/malate metabolism